MSKAKWLASTCIGKRGAERFLISPMGKIGLRR